MFYISEKHKKTPLPHSNHVPAVPVEQSNETLNQVALLSKGGEKRVSRELEVIGELIVKWGEVLVAGSKQEGT